MILARYINNVGSGNRFDGTFPTAKNPDKQFKKLGTCESVPLRFLVTLGPVLLIQNLMINLF